MDQNKLISLNISKSLIDNAIEHFPDVLIRKDQLKCFFGKTNLDSISSIRGLDHINISVQSDSSCNGSENLMQSGIDLNTGHSKTKKNHGEINFKGSLL